MTAMLLFEKKHQSDNNTGITKASKLHNTLTNLLTVKCRLIQKRNCLQTKNLS